MATLSIHKLTALPTPLDANTIYVIAPPANPDFVEIYVTSATGEAKRVIDEDRVGEMISAAIAGLAQIQVVEDITARDALTLETNAMVLVLDASDDATVASGAATYLWDATEEEFVKIAEYESMDLSLTWSALSGKPSSAVADIDDAVGKRHAHANKTQLDKIGESSGLLTYDGGLPKIGWDTSDW